MSSSTLYSAAAACAPANTESQNSVRVDLATMATRWRAPVGAAAAQPAQRQRQQRAGQGFSGFRTHGRPPAYTGHADLDTGAHVGHAVDAQAVLFAEIDLEPVVDILDADAGAVAGWRCRMACTCSAVMPTPLSRTRNRMSPPWPQTCTSILPSSTIRSRPWLIAFSRMGCSVILLHRQSRQGGVDRKGVGKAVFVAVFWICR